MWRGLRREMGKPAPKIKSGPFEWCQVRVTDKESAPTVQPASVAGTMLGAVGVAAEGGRSGSENPREDARASGAAGFLHDVLDVLFDRLFGNGERVRDFLVRMPFGQRADHLMLAGGETEPLARLLGGALSALGNLLHDDEDTRLLEAPAMIG